MQNSARGGAAAAQACGQVDKVIFEDGIVPSLSDFARQVCMIVNAPKPVADALNARRVSPGEWD